MSDIIVKHIKITYEEGDERVRSFVKFLQSDRSDNVLTKYYQQAILEKDGILNVSDKAGNEFTFVCNNAHRCNLQLRGM